MSSRVEKKEEDKILEKEKKVLSRKRKRANKKK